MGKSTKNVFLRASLPNIALFTNSLMENLFVKHAIQGTD